VPIDWLDGLLKDWRVFDTGAFQLRLDALRQQRVEVAVRSCTWCMWKAALPARCRYCSPMGGPEHSWSTSRSLRGSLTQARTARTCRRVRGDRPVAARYAFSGPPPPTGLTGREVARLWHERMTAGFGYDRFAAHASDLGPGPTGWLARDRP
jgi:hypothetical protein